MGNIYIDFGEAINKSNNIMDNGAEITRRADTLKGYESQISYAWKGDAATKFLTKYDKHVGNLKKHGNELRTNAEKLRNSAQRMKNIDEWGKSLFS